MKLHCGCGPIILLGWINIDHAEAWNPDVCMDITKLHHKYQEGEADLVFSCHVLEHLEWGAGVVQALAQIFRVLKPGGTVRIVVPDLEFVATKYLTGQDLKSLYGADHFYFRDCPATRFLYFMRAWQHTIVFDYALLSSLLREAGFINVRRMPFGQSDIPELRNLDRYPEESLICEATK